MTNYVVGPIVLHGFSRSLFYPRHRPYRPLLSLLCELVGVWHPLYKTFKCLEGRGETSATLSYWLLYQALSAFERSPVGLCVQSLTPHFQHLKLLFLVWLQWPIGGLAGGRGRALYEKCVRPTLRSVERPMDRLLATMKKEVDTLVAHYEPQVQNLGKQARAQMGRLLWIKELAYKQTGTNEEQVLKALQNIRAKYARVILNMLEPYNKMAVKYLEKLEPMFSCWPEDPSLDGEDLS